MEFHPLVAKFRLINPTFDDNGLLSGDELFSGDVQIN